MRYPLTVTTPFSRFRSAVYRLLKWPYLVTAIASYSFIALLVIAYMAQSPSFESEMELVLPGTGSSSNVSLDEVGQVVSQTTTPYASGGFNPRVNYKEMLLSRGLLEHAAASMALKVSEFGAPKIRLTEQTSILVVSIRGGSSEQAQNKVWALYESLQHELDRLRADEVARRDTSIKSVLDDYRERLNATRSNILEFQQRSFLVSQSQFEQLTLSLSQLREKQLYVRSELNNLQQFAQELSVNVGVSPSLAGKAFQLQSDTMFRSYMSELDQSAAKLSEYESRWGTSHPKVVAERQRFQSAQQALLKRSESLAGPHAADLFNNLDLEVNPKQAQLFSELISADARIRGFEAELADLHQSEELMSEKLKIYSREAAELDRLQREFDMAEAIFTSAAARLEANKADIFASYPVVQMLTSPSLPYQQVSPKPVLGIAAGIMGIIFITSGLTVLCKRRAIINLLLKKS